MHEFERLFGAQGAKRLNHAECEPGPAVDGEACRLVEHQNARVFVDDRLSHGLKQGVGHTAGQFPAVRAPAQRRQANLVLGGKPVIRLLAATVDAYLPAAQQAVNAAARHPGELPQQEVVEALPGRTLPDAHPPSGRRADSIGGHRATLTY